MKNRFKILTFVAILFAICLSSCADDKIISESELPQEIQTYIETHFPNNPIIQITFDKDLFLKSYEVVLEENYNLYFSSKSKITNIEGNSKLPDSVIPKQILEYVQVNHTSNFVTAWELESKKQEVELDNGITLEFSLDGAFLRIDN